MFDLSLKYISGIILHNHCLLLSNYITIFYCTYYIFTKGFLYIDSNVFNYNYQ